MTSEPQLRCLQRVRCALCPTCGAPLSIAADLQPDRGLVECAYCGGESVIERRLRTIEADLVEGTDPALVARPPAPFLPAHALTGTGRFRAQCPNCASPVEVEVQSARFDCAYCGTRSKVEARLADRAGAAHEEAAFEAELARFRAAPPVGLADELRARLRTGRLADAPALADELRDLCAREMLTAQNEDEICVAAGAFEPWATLTPRRELALARLMALAARVGPRAEAALVERVVAPTAAAAWKAGERRSAYVRGVVRAAGRALFAPARSAKVLDALGFTQPAATLKLLLEVAEWSLAAGRDDDAVNALAAAGSALDFRRGMYHIWRDKVDRAVVGEIVLYRLLYLTPPLVAWALDQLPRWQVDDHRKVARFMDDCALERPALAPLLRDVGIARPPAAQTFAEYAEHLATLAELRTPTAREYALRCRTFDPEGWDTGEDPAPLPGILAQLAEHCADPALSASASFELTRFVAQVEHRDLPAVHEFVRARWAVLPPSARAVYALHAPDLAPERAPVPRALFAHAAQAAAREPFALAVARGRGRVARDYEATRIDDDLEEAARAAERAVTAALASEGMRPSDQIFYVHSCALHAAWLAYRATRDARFKDVLARHELALCGLVSGTA